MSNLINEYCLNCKKRKCNGNCKDLRNYIKDLINKKIITKRGGRPKINTTFNT